MKKAHTVEKHMKIQCSATTKSGTRCNRNVAPFDKVCSSHMPQCQADNVIRAIQNFVNESRLLIEKFASQVESSKELKDLIYATFKSEGQPEDLIVLRAIKSRKSIKTFLNDFEIYSNHDIIAKEVDPFLEWVRTYLNQEIKAAID